MNSYEDYLKQQENQSGILQRIFDKAKPVHIILLAVLVFIGNKMINTSSGNNKIALFIVLGLGALYFFSIMKQDSERKAIPRNIAQEIARRDLIREIDADRSYLHGTKVIPTSIFKDQVWDSGEGPKLFKYNFGFRIKEPNKAPIDIIYQMNPFTGEAKGITELTMGFSGEDVKDIQQIFPEKILKKGDKED